MTVAELIAKLQEMPQDLPVVHLESTETESVDDAYVSTPRFRDYATGTTDRREAVVLE